MTIDQLSSEFQKDHKEFSKYSLLNKYYDAKKKYYLTGNSKLTDSQYDALESSITAIHGPETLKEYGCVGYDENAHKSIYEALKSIDTKIKDRYCVSQEKELCEIND